MKTLEEKKVIDPRYEVSEEEMREAEEDFIRGDKPTYTLQEILEIAKREDLHKNRR
jgi:hypothetical protein